MLHGSQQRSELNDIFRSWMVGASKVTRIGEQLIDGEDAAARSTFMTGRHGAGGNVAREGGGGLEP